MVALSRKSRKPTPTYLLHSNVAPDRSLKVHVPFNIFAPVRKTVDVALIAFTGRSVLLFVVFRKWPLSLSADVWMVGCSDGWMGGCGVQAAAIPDAPC